MKRLLYCLPLLTLLACGGGVDPEPEIAGTYEMTQYTTPGANGIGTVTYNFPYTNPQNNQVYTGSVKIARNADNRVGIVYIIGIQGRTPMSDSLNLSLRSGGGKFEMYDGANRVGTIDETTFNYDSRTEIGTNTLQFSIKAKRAGM